MDKRYGMLYNSNHWCIMLWDKESIQLQEGLRHTTVLDYFTGVLFLAYKERKKKKYTLRSCPWLLMMHSI